MSLYHEAAAALTAPSTAEGGSNLKTRIFGTKSGSKNARKKGKEDGKSQQGDKKTPAPAQVYALAVETAKWSEILAEVIDRAELLVHERQRFSSSSSSSSAAVLALLLVHDLLLSPSGIRLPSSHGLHAAVARHKARLAAELTRARLRRHAPTLDVLRAQVERAAAISAASSSPGAASAALTRWVRINTLQTTLEVQLATTFASYQQVDTLADLWDFSSPSFDARRIHVDEHVPNLVAVPLLPSSASTTDLPRSAAYRSGAIIFQDKASCFPAYLLDPASLYPLQASRSSSRSSSTDNDDAVVDLVDACAAPGNKTSHLAALVHQHTPSPPRCIFAFEKDTHRAKTLQSMLRTAGALDMVTIAAGQDFLQVQPTDACYRHVRALLLDPSCSGSGIVGRDDMPVLHLPKTAAIPAPKKKEADEAAVGGKKRKRGQPPVGEDKNDVQVTSEEVQPESADPSDAAARLTALSTFQLAILLHAFRFPAARRVTYSTCSVHAQENEQVVVRALAAAAAEGSGWRLLRRDEQVDGLQRWPVRGEVEAAEMAAAEAQQEDLDAVAVAEACIRSYPDDGRGIMGFFVAAFVREEGQRSVDIGSQPKLAKDAKKSKKSKNEKNETSKAELPDRGEDTDEWGGFDD